MFVGDIDNLWSEMWATIINYSNKEASGSGG